MPSLFRFVVLVATLFGAVFGVLYVLATQFEPQTYEISKPVANVKVKK